MNRYHNSTGRPHLDGQGCIGRATKLDDHSSKTKLFNMNIEFVLLAVGVTFA